MRAHPLADPEKGSGIAMICTFGDITDVTWWRELRLPARPVLGWDGRLHHDAPVEQWDADALAAYGELAGKTVNQARTRIVELLRDADLLIGEPKPITHAVKYYETRRAAARDRDDPAVVHPQRRARRSAEDGVARARQRAGVASRLHARSLRVVGGRVERRLVGEPSTLLRHPDPGVVPDRE